MSLYYKQKLISGVRDVPSMTLAQYNALTNKPKLWIRTDAPSGDRGINADDIEYDNDTSVKEKIDSVSKCKLIAKSNANQTYVAQFTEILVAFNGLTVEQKMRSLIKLGNGVYTIQNISTGVFTQNSVSGNSVVMASFSLYDKTYKYIINNFTIQDGSSTTSTNDMELYTIGD